MHHFLIMWWARLQFKWSIFFINHVDLFCNAFMYVWIIMCLLRKLQYPGLQALCSAKMLKITEKLNMPMYSSWNLTCVCSIGCILRVQCCLFVFLCADLPVLLPVYQLLASFYSVRTYYVVFLFSSSTFSKPALLIDRQSAVYWTPFWLFYHSTILFSSV